MWLFGGMDPFPGVYPLYFVLFLRFWAVFQHGVCPCLIFCFVLLLYIWLLGLASRFVSWPRNGLPVFYQVGSSCVGTSCSRLHAVPDGCDDP